MAVAITNRLGSSHITPEQDSMWHRGFSGLPTCVIPDAETDNFESAIHTNNEVRIGSGIAMLQGRLWCVPIGTYDPLTIQNGNQGENRIDLAVLRWTINSETNTENCAWVVIQGTPTTGDPTAPGYTEGDLDAGDLIVDMPMYQITLNGLNIVSVTALFDTALTLEAARISDTTVEKYKALGFVEAEYAGGGNR